MKNPQTAPLARQHPKLWWLARLIELAPSKTLDELTAQLKQDALDHNRRNPNGPRFQPISKNTIKQVRSQLKLISQEQRSAVLSRIRRKRTPNTLGENERRNLVIAGNEIIENLRLRENQGIDAGALRLALMRQIENEAIYFKPNISIRKIPFATQWKKYVKARMRFFLLDAIKSVGSYTRSGKLREPLALEAESQPTRVESTVAVIKFKRRLKPKERAVVEWLKQGLSHRQIAAKMGLTRGRITQIVGELRKAAQRGEA